MAGATEPQGSLRNAIRSIREHLNYGHKKQMVGLAFLLLILAIFDVGGLATIFPLVQLASKPEVIHTNKYLRFIYDNLHFSSDKGFLLFAVLGVLFFFIIKSAFGVFVIYLQGKFSANAANYISKKQFSKYFSLTYFNFTSIKSSEIINHTQQNPISYITWVVNPLLMLLSEFIILALIVTLIAVYNFKLFVFISLTVGPATYLVYLLVRKRNERLGREQDRVFPLALGALSTAIIGYVDIKLANKIEFYRNKFLKHQDHYHYLSLNSMVLNMVPFRLNELIALLGIVVIFIYALFFNDRNQDVLMMVGLFAAAAYRIMPSINRILNSLMYINKNQVGIDNLNVYNEYYVEQETKDENKPIPFKREIKFENISFTFPDSKKPVIDEMSFQVKKGEKIGFVGSSGSGKTTLMNILLRFFEEKHGKILVDDVPLKSENTNYWRSLIGYVKQDIFILDTSIKENIAFGEEKVDEEKLWRCIKQASLEDFIRALPNGVETEVGERGSKLSGGQRQRIGIARSLYRNAEILVFDEATSALDNETEKEVSESIDSLSDTNKTIFIIAHRITTLKNCDRIYELKEGKISGVYKYSDLLEKVL